MSIGLPLAMVQMALVIRVEMIDWSLAILLPPACYSLPPMAII